MKLTIDRHSYTTETTDQLCTKLLQSDQAWQRDAGSLLHDWHNDEETISVTTSGSTGTPQLISHTKSAMRASAQKTGTYFGLGSGTTALACLPYSFIAGKMMLIRAITLDWDLIVTRPSSNPISGLDRAIDFIALTPHQLSQILTETPDKLEFIKNILLGGGPVSPALQRQIEALENQIFIGYGMTETITHIAVRRLNGADASEAYQALPGVSFRQNEHGSLIIDADHLPDVLHTTDIVDLHSDQSFSWLGRQDNVINSGGIKIHPESLEHLLSTEIRVPFFVYGVPDDVLGERVELFIESSDPSIRNEVLQHLAKLTGAKRPKQVHLCPVFQYTSTGKIRRNETVMQTLKS